MKNQNKYLSPGQQSSLITILELRFQKNKNRHKNIDWATVEKKLEENPDKLWSLNEMEISGGEPDVVVLDDEKAEIIFIDCSAETPAGRRSLCYDRVALESRKENKPKNSATDMAETMGIDLLSEEQYRKLQTIGNFDLKTSSWVLTDEKVRKLGGALFCDRRYDTVFLYHNGAESYYAARGFRGLLKV